MATVTLHLDVLNKMTNRAAEGGLRAALGKGESILKGDILNRPGTGKTYGKHTASAPGEPPAPDLGNFKANTNADPDLKTDREDLVGTIVANSAQAQAMEKGTERMAARPYFAVLANDHKEDLRRAFIDGAKL